MDKKIAVITGATAGFGKAAAFKLAGSGWDLILVARRKELLDTVKTEIEKKFGTQVLSVCLDVRDRAAVESAVAGLTGKWRSIDALINNAGLAVGMEHIQDGLVEDWEAMIDTNIKGLLYVTRAIAPLMVVGGKGHIINLGSTAGKTVYENGNVYCATKFAVDALSRAMRIDMLKNNIKVTQICPGLAETEFSVVRFKGDTDKAKKTYNGVQPLVAEDIAEIINYVLNLPPHVCINDLTVTCTAQADAIYVNRK